VIDVNLSEEFIADSSPLAQIDGLGNPLGVAERRKGDEDA
jgi:hypothetical protein